MTQHEALQSRINAWFREVKPKLETCWRDSTATREMLIRPFLTCLGYGADDLKTAYGDDRDSLEVIRDHERFIHVCCDPYGEPIDGFTPHFENRVAISNSVRHVVFTNGTEYRWYAKVERADIGFEYNPFCYHRLPMESADAEYLFIVSNHLLESGVAIQDKQDASP